MAAAQNKVPELRPVWETIFEIVVISLATITITIMPVALPRGEEDSFVRVVDWATVMGESVLTHIGWGFGVYIPTLLGFYVIVTGKQLVLSTTAGKTRQNLAYVAEVMTAMLAPALLFAIIACIATPRNQGALFIIVPASVVMLFLAIQLGGFVFGHDQRLAAAQRSRDWAEKRLGELASPSQRSLWVVMLANILAAAIVGVLVSLLSPRPELMEFALYAAVAVILVVVSIFGLLGSRIARDRITGVFTWFFVGFVYLLFVILAVMLLTTDPSLVVGGVAVAVMVIVIAASTFWPPKNVARFALGWTLQEAATAYAVRSVERTYRKAVREIRELTHETDVTPMSFSDRLGAAVRAFRTRGTSTTD